MECPYKDCGFEGSLREVEAHRQDEHHDPAWDSGFEHHLAGDADA